MPKRVVALGDLHCGHFCGLTPPDWISQKRFAQTQLKMWGWFDYQIRQLQPIDVLIVNGDSVDGKGHRSGAVELIEPDLERQAEMAVDVIRHVGAKKIFMTTGTPYHVASEGMAVENLIAREVGAEIGGHLWIDVNGHVFDAKHKVGSSSIPHGRSTAAKRAALWNAIWAERRAITGCAVRLAHHRPFREKQKYNQSGSLACYIDFAPP